MLCLKSHSHDFSAQICGLQSSKTPVIRKRCDTIQATIFKCPNIRLLMNDEIMLLNCTFYLLRPCGARARRQHISSTWSYAWIYVSFSIYYRFGLLVLPPKKHRGLVLFLNKNIVLYEPLKVRRDVPSRGSSRQGSMNKCRKRRKQNIVQDYIHTHAHIPCLIRRPKLNTDARKCSIREPQIYSRPCAETCTLASTFF